MFNLLITRPDHDKVTSYLFQWNKEILNFASQNAIKVIDLKKDKANKGNVESYLKKQNPKLVLFNGHGNDTSIAGFKDKILIETGKNEQLLNNKITYALSCSSAKILGRYAIKKGAKAFIGYEDSFMLYTDSNRETTPLKDKIAASFLKPSNKIGLSLMKSNTVKEASVKSKDAFKKEIGKFMTSTSIEGGDRIAMALLWNLTHQVVLGDQNAKLSIT